EPPRACGSRRICRWRRQHQCRRAAPARLATIAYSHNASCTPERRRSVARFHDCLGLLWQRVKKISPLHVFVLVAMAAGCARNSPAMAQACRVLDPELQEAYAGPCVNGLAQGPGHARGRAEYQGEFSAGMKHGKGVKTWPNGDRYAGEFVQDRKEGKGIYTYGRGPWSGERYEGEWVADQRQGHGSYSWPTGDVYKGPWEADRLVGPPTPMMRARARWAAEARAALAPGQKACKELEVGIGDRDWIRGVVVDTQPSQVAVRVDDAGRVPHLVGGQQVRTGMVLVDAPTAWVPCY